MEFWKEVISLVKDIIGAVVMARKLRIEPKARTAAPAKIKQTPKKKAVPKTNRSRAHRSRGPKT